MSFFLDCALPQKFLYIIFAGQGALGLIVKFRFLPFFRCFHPANGDFGSSDFIPPTAQPPCHCILQSGWFCAEVSEFLFPALCMALFGFGHAQKNALASLIALASSQIAISLRGFDFCPPIALNNFDRLLRL
jgi:hypothetical protein